MSDQGWKHMTLLKKTKREENGDKHLDINKNGCHSFTSSYGQYQVLTFNHLLSEHNLHQGAKITKTAFAKLVAFFE